MHPCVIEALHLPRNLFPLSPTPTLTEKCEIFCAPALLLSLSMDA